MLIVMAGLPGTGKSCLADRIAKEIGAVVLNKDRVRATLFPGPALDYSTRQDDLCMAAIYQAAVYIHETRPGQIVIIDGRTFSRAYQIEDLVAHTAARGEAPRIIECVCDDETARRRLEGDAYRDEHPAKNRNFTLYQEVKKHLEPIALPHLIIDTGKLSPEECVNRCLEYLRRG